MAHPSGGTLPQRAGERPEVHFRIPQSQLTDTAPRRLQEELFDRIARLEGVTSGPSEISVPGARGFVSLSAEGPDEAFLVPDVREFAHLHPAHDGSLHLALPLDLAGDAIARGWAQPHMWAGVRLSPGFLMVYGPRDEAELAVVTGIVEASYRFAHGRS